jgi:Protein of unknown function (DUF2958)
MTLLTDEIKHQLSPLYSTEQTPDPIAWVKFFTPDASWTWYATEFDGEDTLFGLVQGQDEEMGYFSLSELQTLQGPFGLRVERDISFKPTPLSALRNSAAA